MNLFVADPDWGWWIVFYFFLGGIGSGAYFISTLIELLGNEEDRDLSRVGYWIAFPAILLCGLMLTVDLHRPERFWHMLFKSEVVHESLRQGWPLTAASWREMIHAPLVKYWSPMSLGSWALTLFGLCSSLSFLGSLSRHGKLAWLFRRSWLGRALAVIGSSVGFFVAAYTGTLLTATNQPIWSDSVWIAPLFLTSAASTGISTMILVARWQGMASARALDRLEKADLWALGLELAVFTVFLVSLGAFFVPLMSSLHGRLLVIGTLLLGLLLPLAIHLRLGMEGRWAMLSAAAFALLGGFVMRYGIVNVPPELLRRGPEYLAVFSPEDGRRHGSLGADPGNRPTELQPRSKVFGQPQP